MTATDTIFALASGAGRGAIAVLRLSLSDIGAAFGRDRTTVGHACNVVEDRRDDAAFDAFVSAIERVVLSVFGPAGIGSHA